MSTVAPKPDARKIAAADRKRAVSLAEEIGRALRQDFPQLSSWRDALAVQGGFKRGWSPPGERGAPCTKRISRAYRDWLSGMRGVELYERNIPNYRSLTHWERRGRAHALNQSISRRRRMEEKKRNRMRPASAPDAKSCISSGR